MEDTGAILYDRQSLRLALFTLPQGTRPEVIVWKNKAFTRRADGGYQQAATHQIGDYELPVRIFDERV